MTKTESAHLTALTDERINELLIQVGPTTGIRKDSRDLELSKIAQFARAIEQEVITRLAATTQASTAQAEHPGFHIPQRTPGSTPESAGAREAELLLALQQVSEAVQQFKGKWMELPNFGQRLNREIRQGMSAAVSVIVNLDAVGGPLDLNRHTPAAANAAGLPADPMGDKWHSLTCDGTCSPPCEAARPAAADAVALPAPDYWMSIQHGEFKVSYTDDSDPAYKWFPVWTQPATRGTAGSATGIDLSALEDEVRMYEGCGYMHARLKITDAYALIALARATPQHPEADRLTAAHAAIYREAIARLCEGWTLPHDVRKVLETALWAEPEVATPQHGVTEQDEPSKFGSPDMQAMIVAHALTQPLASTAATQPEQASELEMFKEWLAKRDPRTFQPDAYWDHGYKWSAWQARAALAIPASTAASEQQAGADELPPLPVTDDVDGPHGSLEVYFPSTVADIQREAFEAGKRSALTHRATTADDAALRKMRSAFHISMMRAYPEKSHMEIYDAINKAVGATTAADQQGKAYSAFPNREHAQAGQQGAAQAQAGDDVREAGDRMANVLTAFSDPSAAVLDPGTAEAVRRLVSEWRAAMAAPANQKEK